MTELDDLMAEIIRLHVEFARLTRQRTKRWPMTSEMQVLARRIRELDKQRALLWAEETDRVGESVS